MIENIETSSSEEASNLQTIEGYNTKMTLANGMMLNCSSFDNNT